MQMVVYYISISDAYYSIAVFLLVRVLLSIVTIISKLNKIPIYLKLLCVR